MTPARAWLPRVHARRHLGNSTSTEVLREVQDAIVQEVTSFPVEKVALGDVPLFAMHVPISLLRAAVTGGVAATVADIGGGMASRRAGRAAVEGAAHPSGPPTATRCSPRRRIRRMPAVRRAHRRAGPC